MSDPSNEELANLIRERQALQRGDPPPPRPPAPPDEEPAPQGPLPKLVPINWEIVWSVFVALVLYSILSGLITWAVLEQTL